MAKAWYRLFRHETAFTWAVLLLTSIPFFPEYCAPLLAVGSLIAAMADARSRGTTVQIGDVGKLLLVYLFYLLIGTLYSEHPLNSLATVGMWAVMFCGYLALVTVVNTRHRLHVALFCVGAVAAIIGVIALVQYVWVTVAGEAPTQFWLPLDEFLYRFFPLDLDLHMADHRVSATFNNPNIFAEYISMVLPLIGYCAFTGFRTRRTLLVRCFLFLAVIGAAVSLSRGAYIAMLSMLLMLIVTNLKRITPLALCLVAGVSLLPEAITGRFLSIGQGASDFAIFERFEAWDVAIQTIVGSPLFGLGPGVSNFWERLQAAGVDAPHSHNLVLQLMVEGGFIALFIMCLIAIKLLQNGLEIANRRHRHTGVGNALVIFVVAFIVYGMVDYPFLSPKLVGNFLMILGFADAIAHVFLPQELTPITALPQTIWRRIRGFVHSLSCLGHKE